LQRVWKTVPSIRLLSGLTCEPSIQNRGAAEWISSLEASHASHTASQGTSSEETIQGNSQEKSLESPTGLDFQTSFLKMFPESSDSTGTPSDPNYERWVTHLRRDSSQRQKRAHLTSESVSSSWPTPNANEDRAENYTLETSQRHLDEGRQVHLAQVAKLMWPTPRAAVDHMGLPRQNDRGDLQAAALTTNWPTPDTQNARDGSKARKAAKGAHAVSLHHKAANWPTPTVEDAGRTGSQEGWEKWTDEKQTSQYRLRNAIHETNWPTPRSSPNENRTTKRPPSVQKGKHGKLLAGEAGEWAENWPTPDSNTSNYSGEGYGPNLREKATNWPTPASRDYKGFDPPGKQNTKSDPEMYLSIPQAPTTTPDGHTCSTSCRRLNPRFAEMLMGLPPGWTDDSEPLATESFRQWQHSLSRNLAGGYD